MVCKLTSKIEGYYDKNANESKLIEVEYVYVLQLKADHQGSEILFTEFRWLGPYIIEKVPPNNKYMERKIVTIKIQVFHCMRMRQFIPHRPPPDIRITPQEGKLDPQASLKHADLYARAWECEYEEPIFDAHKKNATPPNSLEIPVRSDVSTEETRNTPGTEHECSSESFPQTEQVRDATDTYPYNKPNVETSSEQPNNSPINPRRSKYKVRHNPKPNCNDDSR